MTFNHKIVLVMDYSVKITLKDILLLDGDIESQKMLLLLDFPVKIPQKRGIARLVPTILC